MLPQSWTHQRDYERAAPLKAPDAPVPFWDAVKRGARDQLYNVNEGGREAFRRNLLLERHREIERLTGQRLDYADDMGRNTYGSDVLYSSTHDPYAPNAVGEAMKKTQLTVDQYEARIEALRAQYPALAHIQTRDQVVAASDQGLRSLRSRSDAASQSGLVGGVAAFIGGAGASVLDLPNLIMGAATGPIGAGRPLLARMAMQGAAGSVAEVVQIPGRAEAARVEGGPEYSGGEAVADMAMAGVGSAGVEALMAGGRGVWRGVAGRLGRSNNPDDRGLANAIERQLDDEALYDPDGLTGLYASDDYGSPYEKLRDRTWRDRLVGRRVQLRDVHVERDLDDLFANQPQSPPQQGLRPEVVTGGAKTQPGLQSAEYMGRTIWNGRFDPLRVEADPARFQYKADGDADGVTSRLKGVERWDATASGKAILFEDMDGRVVVADGHQRRGLARRLAEQGWEDAQLDGYLFRASDGWSARDVRVVAALKNIREGSGSIMDAAKLFREAPVAVKDKSLPVTGDFIHQARQLASLSDAAFGAVVNGVIPERYGAVLGEVVGDRPELQGDLVDLLRRGEPGSIEGARALIHEALLDDFIAREGVQGDLFGGLPRESTVIARGKIREAVMRSLRKDERTFSALVKNADAVEAGGNILARNENEARLAIDRASQEVVSRLALRSGEIGEAFSDMAKAVTQGELTPANAAKGLVQRIRNGVKTGELLELERTALFDPDPPSEAGLRAANDFSEPAGAGQRAQLEPKPEDAELETGEVWGQQSAIRGPDGRLTEVYHGSKSGFINRFDPSKRASATGVPDAQKGIFFAASKETAGAYGEVFPYQLDIKNPMDHDYQGQGYIGKWVNDIIDQALEKGHDGLILRNIRDGGPLKSDTLFVAFDEGQIRPAGEPRGLFDDLELDVPEERALSVLRACAPGGV